MRFNWANTLLLVLVLVELVTGALGLVSGSVERGDFMVVHRVAGYGISVVLGWKAANVVVSLRRPRSAAPRAATMLLVAALATTLVLGFVWSLTGSFALGWFSGLSWHIYAGAALLPLLLWHSLYHTRGLLAASSRACRQTGGHS